MHIKHKLAALTSLLIIILFVGYSLIQYNSVSGWMLDAQKDTLRMSADQIKTYFSEQEEGFDTERLEETKRFMERFVQTNQMFRLLDNSGHVIMVLTNNLPADWVPIRSSDLETLSRYTHGQDHLLVIRAPINTEAFKGYLEFASNLENIDAIKYRLKQLMIVLGILGIAVSAIGGFFLAWRLLRPLDRLATVMATIQKKGLSERVEYHNNGDELARLSAIFNEMMDALELSFNRQSQFVEDASHEFRTPIAIIEGHLKLLNRWGKDDPAVREESIAAALQETVRLRKLANQLLDLAGDSSPKLGHQANPIDPSSVIQMVVRNYQVLYPHFEIESYLQEGSHLRIDPHHLEQILIIIMDNAIQHSNEDKHIRLVLQSEAECIIISIRDHGAGIPPESLPHLFERFYRVDSSRERKRGGSGLGLAIAKRITETNSGTIVLNSELGKGTVVTLTFPRAKP
ncbi:HAMP domain-containing sensor histidine kinase [Paenibacillus albus]|uniref:Signal transduction histidine-protein kinase ArlS n=1 Tax=Paenibacillus albus TaxID=2495582 RepID=A0A3Q8X6E3_9BACL|nr:HAMP domain-containing histidine kinase [Paenibacillus albus]AZN41109.1 HAMP domain-containing histidine kinase [Paenibacillus albus]